MFGIKVFAKFWIFWYVKITRRDLNRDAQWKIWLEVFIFLKNMIGSMIYETWIFVVVALSSMKNSMVVSLWIAYCYLHWKVFIVINVCFQIQMVEGLARKIAVDFDVKNSAKLTKASKYSWSQIELTLNWLQSRIDM